MTPKRSLGVNTLQENCISYHDELLISRDVKEYLVKHYPQASIVTEGLLDCKNILSRSSYEKLSERSQKKIRKNFRGSMIPPLDKRSSVDLESYEERYQTAQHDARFELARRIQRSAKDIKSGKEPRWSAVVKNELFGNLIESSRRAEGIKVFDAKQIVERVMVEDEDTWEHGHKSLQRTTPLEAPDLTAPKPDLYIALPIIKRTSNPEGFHRDDYIQNFTENNLALLEQVENGNLISNPMTRLYKKTELNEKDLVCFPCAVVEIKHHRVRRSFREKCYCQAANATATALSMLSRLSHLSIPNKFFTEIQPVVAFTFIGHQSRVWIAVISDRRWDDDELQCGYEMQCIWKGDLRVIWDTVQLCRIIENLHYWIVRHYRPWVSSCLDRWRWVVKTHDEKNDASMGELDDLLPSEIDLMSEEDYDEDSSEESESEEGEYSEDEDDDEDVESEVESVGTPISISRVSRPRNSRDEGIPSSKSLYSTPQRRSNAATLSPEVLLTKRPQLHYDERNPLPLRHVRNHSTG
ncbi:uncharacterized protein BP5553_06508 [Venustampulla echinocandica]|uniref:Uncharacterized protein n=1 Tax=Venustampulla echinocandica TaxID=2656787 RepID=A0A370TK44_9HELO|nr:uncharacterized protein BP5553_06508 [Venustampulla echinocandica]RDL35896.1 hypothetical protein BP5553_06508 [Venustampulla echinocandica]